MKRLFSLVLLAISYLLLTTNVIAQYGQPSITYSILIDKMVGKPSLTKGGSTDYEYVDNLSPSDSRFRPGQTVSFKVKIKNTSNVKLTNVVLKDFIPSYLEPIEGPGSYDTTTRTIIYNAGDFATDEEKVYYIKAQIFSQDKLPADKGLFCLVNKVTASTDQAADDDTVQFCVEKEVLGTAKVPSAGPEMGIFLLTGELLTLSVGLFIRKKMIS